MRLLLSNEIGGTPELLYMLERETLVRQPVMGKEPYFLSLFNFGINGDSHVDPSRNSTAETHTSTSAFS